MRAFDFTVQLRRTRFDIDVPNAFVFNVPVKLGLEHYLLTMARTYGFVSTGQMLKHYEQHGQNFGAKSPKEYARMAEEFLTGDTPNHVLECTRKKGEVVRFDPITDSYGVLDANGVTRTFLSRSRAAQ